MTLLYIHGFNSDGEGWKAEALRRQYPQATVLAPDFPADPHEVVSQLARIMADHPDMHTVIGTSLGGFYAYWVCAHYRVPALLFNPSMQPHLTLDGRGIGQFRTWTKHRDYHFRPEYLPQLAALGQAADASIDTSLLRFFLATDDEVLDHSALPAAFPHADIRHYDGAGHGFSKFEKVLKVGKSEGWLCAPPAA
jgi:predicted esterase YcpF (UPF0227 family)